MFDQWGVPICPPWMQPFGCKLCYFGRREKPDMKKVNAKLYTDLHEFLGQCDVVTINVPLSGSFCSTDANWEPSVLI